MTQEELDALMAGDELDLDSDVAVEEDISESDEVEEEVLDIEEELSKDESSIMPPAATEDNKVVSQLDTVTKDSEAKATEIFDKLDAMSEFIANVEEESSSLEQTLKDNIEIFQKLSNRFDDVEIFKEFLEKNQNALEKTQDITQKAQMSSDEIMMIMDTMQYQDIHRQKIERVINVMRGLLRYMNTLFGSDIKDEDRVSSAQHIIGDKEDHDVVSNEDIEALLESFGKK